jgi:adenylyltransferase/sulfurtransferase
LTAAERDRYSRQILFPGIGDDGQERLLKATVALAGCGALGCFHAEALARGGIGRLIVVDRDYVEASNLQRQFLFEQRDAENSMPKAAAARGAIERINPAVKVTAHVADITAANIEDLLEGADLILDGTDNFETRYLLNDFAVWRGVPWIYGAAVGSYGITMPVIPASTCCLSCVYPDPPSGVQPTCETAGVLNTITATVAALQVSEAIKLLCGRTDLVARRITTLDVWSGTMRQIDQPAPDPECRVCGRREFHYLEGRRRAPVSLCGRNAVQIHERERPLDLESLAEQLRPLGEVRANDFALRFFTPPYDLTFFPDGRAIIKGTTDTGIARSLYAKYVGA